MSDPQSNRKILQSFCTEVFNNHDLSGLAQFMTDDYIQHNPDCPQGKSGFTEFFQTIGDII
jgi:predicted SnoaL-like aldol condensation-catalyzing enzyme